MSRNVPRLPLQAGSRDVLLSHGLVSDTVTGV